MCDNFDKINDGAPILKFENRLRLIKQHLKAADADLIGLSEIDSISGDHPDAIIMLWDMMSELGYSM